MLKKLNGIPGFLRYAICFLVIIVIIVLVGSILFDKPTNQNNKDKKDNQNQNNNQDNNNNNNGYFNPIDNELEACPSELGGLFTTSFANINDYNYIGPMGAFSPPGHTLATHHIYLVFKNLNTIVNAPGDMVLTRIDDQMLHYTKEYTAQTGKTMRHDHYIVLHICKGLSMEIGHVANLSDLLEQAKKTGIETCSRVNYSEAMAKGKGYDYADMCVYNLKYKLKAGDIIGNSGGVDVGVYNQNNPMAFVNPTRYQSSDDFGDSLHGMCALDLYSGDLKNNLYNLLGDKTLPAKFLLTDPKCGTLMQDIAGTLQGNWFGTDEPNGNYENDGRLAVFGHQSFDHSYGAISLGVAFTTSPLDANHAITFKPTHTGTHNREFSEVTPSAGIYCYDEDKNLGWPNYPFKVLVELTDSTHIRIEKQNGYCSSNENFINPYSYER